MYLVVIGLTGGVGSGKSTVAKFFERLGAKVLDADKIGHYILNLPKIKKILVGLWEKEILNEAGKVSRKVLAEKVFKNSEEVKRLNAILHPQIKDVLDKKVEKMGKSRKILVIDGALLLESGYSIKCNRLLFVDVPLKLRQERTVHYKKWDKNEVIRREELQIPLKEKRRYADFIIDNSKSKALTFRHVKHIIGLLQLR